MELEYMNRFANQIWPIYWNDLPVNEFELDTYLKIVNSIRENRTQFDQKTRRVFISLVQLMRHTISNIKYPETDIDHIHISDDDELYCCLRIEDDLHFDILTLQNGWTYK